MAAIDYPVFDADNHYYETRDAFSRHIPTAQRDKAIHTRIDDDGVERVYVGDKRFTFLEHRNFDTVVPPGALYLLGDNRLDSVDSRHFGPVPVAAVVGRVDGRLFPSPGRLPDHV